MCAQAPLRKSGCLFGSNLPQSAFLWAGAEQTKAYRPAGFHLHSPPGSLPWKQAAQTAAGGHADTHTVSFPDSHRQRYQFHGRPRDHVKIGGVGTSKQKASCQASFELTRWDILSMVLEPNLDNAGGGLTPGIRAMMPRRLPEIRGDFG
jgi:hypothetical protein